MYILELQIQFNYAVVRLVYAAVIADVDLGCFKTNDGMAETCIALIVT